MEAGREMDALVAERVMGWERVHPDNPDSWWIQEPFPDGTPRYATHAWSPSTNIADAWEVFRGFSGYGIAYAHGNYVCRIYLTEDRKSFAYADADTAPLAICRAVMKTVEGNCEKDT